MGLFRSLVLIVVAAFASLEGNAFVQVPTFVLRPHSTSRSTSLAMGALDRQPHESDGAYMKRLMLVASDAATFEKAVLQGDDYDASSSGSTGAANGRYCHQRTSSDAPPTTSTKKKGAYQRAEEWDAQRQANGTMTWEEKVQFDGQRHGNRVNQNNILRHHLNTF